MLRQLSPPKNLADPYRRYYFSVFYTVTHCFTLMNAIIFWAVLFPMGRTGFEQVAGKQPPVPIPEHPLGDLPGVLALKPTSRCPL